MIYTLLSIVLLILAVVMINRAVTKEFLRLSDSLKKNLENLKAFIVTFFVIGFAEYKIEENEEEETDTDSEDLSDTF